MFTNSNIVLMTQCYLKFGLFSHFRQGRNKDFLFTQFKIRYNIERMCNCRFVSHYVSANKGDIFIYGLAGYHL
jgi:hypothetical protein